MSFKKIIMFGLVCALLAMLGAVAHAGWGGCCGFFYFGSVDTALIVKGGSSDPAFVSWTITPEEYEFLCLNPAENTASLTVMLREVSLSTLEGIDQSTGRNGKPRTVTGTIDTDPLADPNDCINPNWIPDVDTVFIRLFDASAEIFTVDPKTGAKREFLATYEDCYLNGTYGADNLPPEGTPYVCASETIVER